ncbi:MAG: DUF4197 domain-containing protein [Burkholderiales bacterium]|nr:DUF4197 domain-containing protein [Burkholderiales bacterium]
MKSILGFLALAVILSTTPARALDLSSLSNQDAAAGMRDALMQGAGKAVELLGRQDGFLSNAKVKIPLPDGLRQIESGLRLIGMKRQADELVVAMNRAAESAVPEARVLLVDAVKKMTLQDAKGILSGGDTAATEYFRRATSAELARRFLPIVTTWTQKVGLAAQYNSLVERGAQLGLVGKDERIENYVTRKALDGLYLVIGEQERAIRKDPVGAATGAARKVFELLK